MKLTQFQQLLERKGSELSAWPVWQRHGARRLLRRSVAAQECYRQARQLDHWLTHSLRESAPLPAGLRERIGAIPLQMPPPAPARRGWQPTPRLLWELAGVTAVLLLCIGFFVGAGSPFDVAAGPDLASLAYGEILLGGLLP